MRWNSISFLNDSMSSLSFFSFNFSLLTEAFPKNHYPPPIYYKLILCIEWIFSKPSWFIRTEVDEVRFWRLWTRRSIWVLSLHSSINIGQNKFTDVNLEQHTVSCWKLLWFCNISHKSMMYRTESFIYIANYLYEA